MVLDVHLMGRFAIRDHGHEIALESFGGRLARRLLRILLVRRGSLVPVDELADLLWGAHPPADPGANVKVLVSRARRALGDHDVIATGPGGYLVPEDAPVATDAERFLGLVAAAEDHARGADRDETTRAFERAVEAWRGDPLPEDAYEEWATPYRRHLAQRHADTLEGWARHALARGDVTTATRAARMAVEVDPFRERGHVLLVRALRDGNDVPAALAAYDTMRRTLADGLGVSPSPEAASLHARLLDESAATAATTAHTDRPRPRALPFAGRRNERSEIQAALAAGSVAVVVGTAGSGKSRLLEVAADETGRLALSARAFRSTAVDTWDVARQLVRTAVEHAPETLDDLAEHARAALAPWLAEIELPHIELSEDSRRLLTIEAAIRCLAAASPDAVLVVDDAQWLADDSLTVVASALARSPGLSAIMAIRPEPEPGSREAAALMTRLREVRPVHERRLGPLTSDELTELVAAPEVTRALRAHTDGSAMAVAQVLNALRDEGELIAGGTGRLEARDRSGLAEAARRTAIVGTRRLLTARTHGQPRERRDLLSLLSLLRREAPAGLLAAALDRAEPDVLRDLDAIAVAGLVRLGEHGWAPSHDLLAGVLVAELGPADRARLHGRLAAALIATPGANPAEIAEHLGEAGDPRAPAHYASAARGRIAAEATDEAAWLVAEGLRLDPTDAVRADLLAARGDVRERLGELRGARSDLRRAIGLIPAGPRRSHLLARLAVVTSGAENLTTARDLAHVARAEAGADPDARARALTVAAMVEANLGDHEQASTWSDEALTLYEQLGDAEGIAEILDQRVMARFLDGDITGAITDFDRVAELFRDVGRLRRVVTPRSTRGHALLFHGRPAAALRDGDEAVSLADSLGHEESRTYTRWHRCEARLGVDRVADAQEDAEQALAIAERLGHQGWTATALRATARVALARDDVPTAGEAYERMLAVTPHVPLFQTWARAGLAEVAVREGDLAMAERHVSAGRDLGPPLGGYELRLADARLGVARRDPDASERIREAHRVAIAGGHLASADALSALHEHLTGQTCPGVGRS